MKRNFLLFLFLLLGCNSKINNESINEFIRQTFPESTKFDDYEKIEREKQEKYYEKEFQMPFRDPLIEKQKLELHHIYEIQAADKFIHGYLEENNIKEIKNNEKN